MLVMIKMEIYKREWDKVAFYKKDSLESCISLAIVHSKGIPLVSAYLPYIGGIPYSVDNI